MHMQPSSFWMILWHLWLPTEGMQPPLEVNSILRGLFFCLVMKIIFAHIELIPTLFLALKNDLVSFCLASSKSMGMAVTHHVFQGGLSLCPVTCAFIKPGITYIGWENMANALKGNCLQCAQRNKFHFTTNINPYLDLRIPSHNRPLCLSLLSTHHAWAQNHSTPCSLPW